MQAQELARVFGENVRRRRTELGMTQADLAQRARMPRPDISDIERGKRQANMATIAKIAEGLTVPPSHLLSAESLAGI